MDPRMLSSSLHVIVLLVSIPGLVQTQTVSFDAPLDGYSVEESTGSIQVCVIVSGAVSTSFTITLSTIPGSAQAFLDFTPITESFTFTRTSGTTDCATINIIQDAILESGEFFLISVTSSSPNVILPSSRLITIIDSNNVVLEFQSSTFSTTEGTAAEVCVVILAGMIARPVAFSVTPSDGTATESGQDFAPISIDRTFTSNSDSPQCFSMTVNEDTTVESDETFVITLSSPDTPTDRIGTVIINDNDGVSLALSSSSLSVAEGNLGTTSQPLCVQLQTIMAGLDRDVPLLLNTTFGTADASDFLPLTNEQFIIPLSTPLNQDVCFDLSINGDVIREADEAFTVTITVENSNDVIVGPNTVTVTILDDNDVIADCMSLLSPQNGNVQFTSTLQDATATYSCITGYTVVGPSNRTCLSSGLWSGSDPTCELVDCGYLSVPNNGAVNDPVTMYQSVATYQCNTGYVLIGESCRICQANGTWSEQEPICQIVDCGALSDPDNGQVTLPSTVYQSQAVYSCNEGYELSQTGSMQRICRANGVWSSFAPQCNPVNCGTLVNPDNGAVSLTGTTFMSSATYSCNIEHTLINGDQVRECQSDGTWSGSQPMCQVDCGELVFPPNGVISYTSGTLLGSMATYTCDPGYDLIGGDALRTCSSDGDWNGMEPTGCQPRDCGDPGVPDNGQVNLSGGTTLGSTATYSCDLGHDLIGETMRECGIDGQWTNSIPTCMVIDCGSLSPPDDGTVQLNGTVFGSQAIYSCNLGYTLVGANMRVCLASQDWSDTAPSCQIIDCGGPNNPENGDVTFTLTVYNAFAIYSCEEGYNLVPSETFRTCEADGNWSGDDRACQPIDCGSWSNPTNGQFNAPQTTLGSVAMYTCNTGYDLIGQENVTCQPSGEWSSVPPNCIPVDCGSLGSPTNGSVSLSGTTFESVAQYTCDLGYLLVGVGSRQCQANRTWSGESPVCEAVDCGGLSDPGNGVVNLDGTRLNSVATYQCNIGYELVGDSERQCTEVGQWSGDQPVCEIVQCTEVLSSPMNGNVIITGTIYLSEAEYSCLEGFAVVGPTTRVCQDDGQWSGMEPHCEENMCPDLEPLENGVIRITDVGFEAGLLATYECNEGYTISSAVDATRICQLSGEWTGTAPTCIINDCGEDPPTPDNGIVLTSGTTFGSRARYFCNDGYEVLPSSGRIRICLANKTWSGVDPTCEPIDCGMLENPLNGDVTTNGTTLGSSASYSCRAGYELEGDATRVCQPNQSWSNTEPSCLDIDECQGDHRCDQECVNDVGGFHCECRTGYQPVDTFTCTDIDECSESNGGCSQLCINTVGSFSCGCSEGYLLSGDETNCDDIDECQGDHGCDQECVNDVGGFYCECEIGYQLVDTFTCIDIDECADSNGGCGQVCNNTVGSFSCGCYEGYLLNSDEIGCDDVDECALELDGCHGNATCLNTNGSFQCLCNDGYDGDGFLCTDIDECLEGMHTCDVNAICNNTDGGFECECLLGYEGEGFICENIDECEIGTHKCHEDADCADNDGSFSCVCKLGFSGDGLSCERQCSTMFQLLLNGVNNCQQWRLESTEEKLLDIEQSVLQELSQTCPTCASQISHIAEGEFSCPNGPDSSDILYRARLYSTQSDDCEELSTAVTNWVQSSQVALLVQNSRLRVAQNCMVEIDSFQSDLDCPLPTTEAGGVESRASVGSATIIGAAAGVVGGIFLLTVVVVIIAVAVILKKKRKRFVLSSHFIDPDQAYSSLTHTSTPLQENHRSQRRLQNNYEEGDVQAETSTFNPDGNVLPTLGRTLSDRRQHLIQSPYAEIGEPNMVSNGKLQQDEFYEKVYDDGYHFDVEEVYDKVQKMPTDDETEEKSVAENPLYEKVEISDFAD